MQPTKINADTMKEDFIIFLHYVWSLLNLPPPTGVQIDIAKYMSNRASRRKIIQAFRGVGKSYIAYAYVVWRIWKDPDTKILVVSATHNRAELFSSTCQNLIGLSPLLAHLLPTSRSSLWNKVKWTVGPAQVSGSPTVLSVGIDSNFTGSRADIILADDVESEKNSMTVDKRERLRRRVSEFESIRKANTSGDQGSEIIYLGTPQNEESLYNSLADLGFDTRIWPGKYPALEQLIEYKGRIDPKLENELISNPDVIGTSTDPKRFTDSDLCERELYHGKADFQLQFMLNTTLSDDQRFPLKCADLVVFPVPNGKAPGRISHGRVKDKLITHLPMLGFSNDRWYDPIFVDSEYLPFEGSVLAIDPSGKGSDELGYAVIKSIMGYLYVTRSGGFDSGYDEDLTLKPLAIIAKEEAVQAVVIEDNFGGGMFTQMFRTVLNRIHPCRIEDVHSSIQKEKRIIDTLEPIMARHRLIFDPSVITQDYKETAERIDLMTGGSRKGYSLFYQMTHISKDRGSLKHDDRLDALSLAVAFFTEKLNRDADKELAKLKDEWKEEYIRKARDLEEIKGLAGRSNSERYKGKITVLKQMFSNRLGSKSR